MSTTNTAQSDMLERALDALERVQTQLENERAAQREPIAVVGLGCRFPGADGADAFADFLEAGGNAVRSIPADRDERFRDAPQALRRGGFFDDIAGFDAALFGISEQEALAMDPQQRLLLEVAWQALEDAGAAGGSLAGSATGVYLGLGAQNSDYAWWLLNDPQGVDRHAIGGSFHSLMPGRLSYLLDLRGPSMVLDAACASGLVAVHLACEALRRRDCDTALAAAVNLVLSPLVSAAVQGNGLWSAQGQCRAFDAAADGFVRGEGCGVLVLKRLSDALEQGDAIRALIHGSAVGQDGRSNGLTAPNGPAQEAIMRRALAQSGIDAAQVGYVEAHATGTLLGDAIEAEALGAVYGHGGGRGAPLLVGALKPNLGHLEAASGMAGLIKTILAVERGRIAPTLHHATLNPDIDPARRIAVLTRHTDWPAQAPYGGVSAFGMSGTNAHLIVGPAPGRAIAPLAPTFVPAFATLWLGAQDESTLRLLAGRIAAALRADMHWPDVCACLNAGRKHFPLRIEVGATDIEEARTILQRAARGEHPLSAAPVSSAPVKGGRKIHLPTYPFRHTRYWPEVARPLAASQSQVQARQDDAPVDLAGMLNQLNWQAAALPMVSRPASRSHLLLTGDAHLAAEMRPGLAQAGFTPFAAEVDNPNSSAAWKDYLAGAPDADLIHFCGADQATDSLAGVLALVKAMADAEAQPRRLFLVTAGAWQGNAGAAMATSLGRSIALEHPDLRCRCIDFDPGQSAQGAVLAQELGAGDGEEWVRRSVHGRLVPRIRPLAIEQRPFAVRPDASYLISGGFGGIGRALAGWLIGRGARDLMLIGRSAHELPEFAVWRARGVRIRALAADIADPAALAAALASLQADGVPLAGVFHAAGVQDDALLYQHAWPRFAEVLRAKVDGARVLHDAVRDLPLDAFVLFSSISALCGLTGAGAYAAANAALGALARDWRAQGFPALSVQWGTWQGSGMAKAGSAQLATHWDALGIRPFAPARGTAALEALLGSGLAEAIAADIDWARLARWARTDGSGARMYQDCIAPAATPVQPASAVEAKREKLSDDALHQLVRSTVAQVLGLPADHPNLDLPFGELGLGSLAAIELRSLLSARLDISVPATVAFNHPSVYAVVRFLSKRIAAADAKSAKKDSPETSENAVESLSIAASDQSGKSFR